MDISSIGQFYFNDYQMNGGAGMPTANANIFKNEKVESFADVLKRTSETQTEENKNVSKAAGTKIDKTDKFYEQCLELETFLIKTLVNSMRKTVMKSNLVNEGFAGKMYEDMLYDEYAKEFAKNANFGLAEQAYLELTGQRGIQRNV